MTCIHSETGLCPDCQADHDEDPTAWMEYGDHPAGLLRYQELLDDMADPDQGPCGEIDTDIPF